jgi:hypothetical protein
LNENIARQLTPESLALHLAPIGLLSRQAAAVAHLVVKRLVITFRFVRQKYEMHERVGVDDDEQDGCQEAEREQRKFGIEEW